MRKFVKVMVILGLQYIMGMTAFAAKPGWFSMDGNVSQTFVNEADVEAAKIPASVLNYLSDAGWDFVITDKNLGRTFFPGLNSSVAGVTDFDGKIVYIEDRTSATSRAVLHEIGHAVDYELGGMSLQQRFQDIYVREKHAFRDTTSVGDGHEISSPTEYFASAWSEFFMNPGRLKALTPDTYGIIQECAYQMHEKCEIAVTDTEFNPEVYYWNYPDLQATIGYNPAALENHYYECGALEGREASIELE